MEEQKKKIKISQNGKLIIGGLFILTSIYLFTAFLSYIFTWKIDQHILFLPTSEILSNADLHVENWLSKFGAIVSHFFMYHTIGITAFVIPLIIFLIGFKIVFNHLLLPIKSTIIKSFWFVIGGSLFFGLISSSTNSYLGGTFGTGITKWLISFIGLFGTSLLILFFIFSLSITIFKPKIGWKKWFTKFSSYFNSKKQDTDSSIKDQLSVTENNIPHKRTLNDDDLILTDNIQTSPKEKEACLDEIETETIILKVKEEENKNESIIEKNIEEKTDSISTDKKETNESIELDSEVKPEQKNNEASLIMEVNLPEEDNKIDEKEEDNFEVTINDESDELGKKELKKALEEFGEFDPTLELSHYKLPNIDLLEIYGNNNINVTQEELEENKQNILRTLENYKIAISSIKATVGPTITLYEIVPAPGVRISKIKSLEDDIALSLAALGIRIIAPMPGKGTIGIEVPNKNPQVVSMKTLLASEKFQKSDMELPLALGKTISNETFIFDLAKMPHLLMAGATGQGKSVGLNAILGSLLYKKHPSQVKFVLVDPKKVELTLFNKIERHFLAKLPDEEEAIITDTSKVIKTLNSLCIEMDNRYELLKNAQVRNIKEYNAKFVNRRLNPEEGHHFLPYIVLVIDEFADLIMTAGKEVETPIARLAQLARAIGIHLIVATQRPSVNVITGIIKANFPARIAFRVSAKIDSRTILDTGGADQLIGRGDMLFSNGNDLIRLQCGFLDTPDVEKVCDYIGNQQAYSSALLLPEYEDENAEGGKLAIDEDLDIKFEEAARLVVMTQQGSTSLIQRKLKLGYNRAGRIVDQMESAGILGPFEGSKARKVLIPDETTLEMFLKNLNKN